MGYKDIITWESIQNPYIPKGMTELMAQQQAYQKNQSVIMEQMKNNIMHTNGKENENGQTENAHAE